VFSANGASFESLGEEEKAQCWKRLNLMSRHPKKLPTPTPKPANDALQNSANTIVSAVDKRPKPSGRKNCAARESLWLRLSSWRVKAIRRR